MVAEIAAEAGFPPGVINVVTHAPGGAAAIAHEFFASDDVRCINSDLRGEDRSRARERAGARSSAPCSELGGYNPMIIPR